MLDIKPKEVEMTLNQKIKMTNDTKCAFRIHHWGVVPNHKSNIIHKHSFFEVCYILQGDGFYIENGIEYELLPGTIFVSTPEKYHSIINKPGLYIAYIAFDIVNEETTDEFIELANGVRSTNKIVRYFMDETSTALLWKSVLYQADTAFCNKDVLKSQCHALIINIIDLFNEKSVSKSGKETIKSKDYSYLSKAKLFIQDNLMQPLQLTDLADYLHISSRHLTRLFKSEAGMPFNHYLQKQRIYLAAELLSTTDIPIKDIAYQAGFNTVQYFTKVFTRYMGSTPGEFRKNHS